MSVQPLLFVQFEFAAFVPVVNIADKTGLMMESVGSDCVALTTKLSLTSLVTSHRRSSCPAVLSAYNESPRQMDSEILHQIHLE